MGINPSRDLMLMLTGNTCHILRFKEYMAISCPLLLILDHKTFQSLTASLGLCCISYYARISFRTTCLHIEFCQKQKYLEGVAEKLVTTMWISLRKVIKQAKKPSATPFKSFFCTQSSVSMQFSGKGILAQLGPCAFQNSSIGGCEMDRCILF